MNKVKADKVLNEFLKPKRVVMRNLNLNQEFINDMKTGKGFLITDSAYTKKTEKDPRGRKIKKYSKNIDGIMSPKFCTDWSDDNAFAERYTCECKLTQGKKKDGEICPHCNTIVEFKDVDYEMTGWIDLKSRYVIAPGYYELLRSLIGKSLVDIYDYKKVVGIDGNIEIDESELKKNPFYGIGLTEFRARFKEILAFYTKKNKDKADISALLIANMDSVFIHAIPVYNAVLRPEIFEYNTYSHYDINTIYKSIYNKSALLESDPLMMDKLVSIKVRSKCEILTQEQILSQVQELVVRLDESITNILKGKDGLIQQSIKGGRMDWTSRCVIVSDDSLEANQIKIPYLSALEMYKFQIIGYLSEIKDISYAKAFNMWNKATLKFDNTIYGIIQYMIKNDVLQILVNRNPTINFGSMQVLTVIDVSTDIHDLTLKMPLRILVPFNADFDGDQLNMYALTTEKFKREFSKIYDPVYSMHISRMTGEFDKSFDLIKDQAITIMDWNAI